MNKNKFFVTDLDGTLLQDNRTIHPRDIESLHRLRKRGNIVVLATGRSLYSFYRLMKNIGFGTEGLNFPADYCIISTGAGVVDLQNFEIIRKISLRKEYICEITKYLNSYSIDYMVHHEIPYSRYFGYRCFNRSNKDFSARIELYCDYAKPLRRNDSLDHFGEATEILCIVSPETGHGLADQILAKFKGVSVITATSPLDGRSLWIEIFGENVSKSSSVRFLSESLGVLQSDVCAVGNDFNDEDLLAWAGQSFITANGQPTLLHKYQNVASNNSGGVTEAAQLWLSLMDSN